jgi:hypothetical protein
MYAHTARDGKPIDGDRLYMGADGELQRVKTYEERDRDRETPPALSHPRTCLIIHLHRCSWCLVCPPSPPPAAAIPLCSVSV